MYSLSIVTTIFLPLGFVTGLFGMNVAGLPGTQSPYAFAILCLVMLGGNSYSSDFFRSMKWM